MPEDVRKTLRDLIVAQITAGSITDDGGGLASFHILFELPPLTLLRDFLLSQSFSALITVGRMRVTPKRIINGVPLIYDGVYPVSTWCVDKNGITGIKLKHKLDAEVESIFEDNPGSFSQLVGGIEDDDHKVGSTMLYNTRFLIKHKRYST